MISPPRQLTRPLGALCLAALLGACSSTGTRAPETNVPAPASIAIDTPEAPNRPAEKVELPAAIVDEFNLGLKAMEQRDYEQAEKIFYAMTQAYPDLSGPYANLGAALLAKKDYPTAATALKRALQLNPDNPEIYNHLGLLYRRDGRFDQALEYYRQGLEIAPDNRNLLRNAGILLELYLNTPEAALQYYQRYIELKPDDRQVQIWIADLSRRIEP